MRRTSMLRFSRVAAVVASFLLLSSPRSSRAVDAASEPPPSTEDSSAGEKRLEAEALKSQSQPSRALAIAKGTTEAKQALDDGQRLYKNRDYPRALERLQAARSNDPLNSQAALLLGLTYVRLDEPGEAAVQWADYVKTSTDRKRVDDIARFTTILLHEENVRSARGAIADEKKLTMAGTDPKTVAVAAFRNLGSPDYAPLGKAFAAMLIDNLSVIPEIRVLERERVEILVAEANLGKGGLVEKKTAVRAGKLLRAGRVVPGSYVDWTKSPTHLKAEASVYEVDSESVLATSSAEVQATEFYELVPKIATDLAAALGRPVSALPPAAAQKVREFHTKSLPAALAAGRAWDAYDRGDLEEAKKQCKEAEKEDPNFELAKRFCGLLPPVWLSLEAVATAVESEVLVAEASLASQLAPWIAGAVVAGGIAGGTIAATSGGGGNGSSGSGITGNSPGGNNPPSVSGVQSNATVPVGSTLTEDISGSDPDGQPVSLTAQNLPANSSFNQTSGTVVNGRFSFTPASDQQGQTFTPRFCATDSVGATTCQVSQIQVTEAAPTPVPCRGLHSSCSSNSQCCSGECDVAFASESSPECCVSSGQRRCTDDSDCCDTFCTSGTCCGTAAIAASCSKPADCCDPDVCGDGQCCTPNGSACGFNVFKQLTCCSGLCDSSDTCVSCLPNGDSCSANSECCSGSCDGTCL